jgi:hypothetical protein
MERTPTTETLLVRYGQLHILFLKEKLSPVTCKTGGAKMQMQ